MAEIRHGFNYSLPPTHELPLEVAERVQEIEQGEDSAEALRQLYHLYFDSKSVAPSETWRWLYSEADYFFLAHEKEIGHEELRRIYSEERQAYEERLAEARRVEQESPKQQDEPKEEE